MKRCSGIASRWIALAALGAVNLMHIGRAGADQGPILVAERPKLDTFHFEPPTAWLDLNYYLDDQKQTSKGAPTTDFTENRFQEILTLQTTGYILHPNLVDLKMEGSFGLEQDLINQSGQRSTQNGTLYDYDVDATLFRKEELPITLYTRRTTSYYSQPFGPSLENILMTEGAIFDWQSKVLPTRVEYYHLSQDQRALDGSQDYKESQDTLTWHSSYAPTQQNHTNFDYTFNSGTDTSSAVGFGGQTVNDFTNNNFSLTNELDFGAHDRDNLQSSLVYFDQTGTYDLSQLHYTENLFLQETDNLSTNFRYLLVKENVGSGFGGTSTDQLLQRGDASFTHQLYKSLITTGDIGLQDLSVQPSGGDTEWFANINTDYTKAVPLGKLDLNVGLGYDQTNNNSTNQVTHIVNQQRTFSGALPLIVSGNNIVPSSLIITDSTGIRVYREGLDYRVQPFPDFLEIDRILGGNIADGQTVLLSYDLGAQPANTLRTNTFSFGGRYDFEKGPLNGLGFYWRYIDQDQNVSTSSSELIVPNSLVDKTIGIDYRIWEMKFLAEQDWHHSSISPYDQLRLDVRWIHALSPKSSFTLNPSYVMARYQENNDRLTAFTILGSIEYRFSPELTASASIDYQDQTDKLFGPNRGLEEQMEVQWSHRQTTVFFEVQNSSLRSSIQTNDYLTIQLGIRRSF